MNEIIEARTQPLPLPATPIVVRSGTLDDVDFLDALQRKTTKQVGFMPRKQFEGKVAAGHVLIAVGCISDAPSAAEGASKTHPTERVGYLIGNDQYFKRDDVGVIYQMNVVPERRRSLVAATLLQAQFARSAYGCKLYCCWCAQDLSANRFWESMGFVPLAYRAGGKVTKGQGARGKGNAQDSSSLAPGPLPLAPSARIHIFWQKRIRQGDDSTPWWFPSLTTGGSIREDRLVLPILPGMHWSEAKPLILPGMGEVASGQLSVVSEEKKTLPAPRKRPVKANDGSSPATVNSRLATPRIPTMGAGRLSFFEVPTPAVIASVPVEKPKREKKAKQKHDPKLVAAARELRDRYLEQCDARPAIAPRAKYEVGRIIEARSPTVALLSAA